MVVKIPRWAFEKFPRADATLGVQMKSVGEAMAIGRTFKEALQKAIRSLEIGRDGLGADGAEKIEPERVRERSPSRTGSGSSTSATRSRPACRSTPSPR